APLACRSRPTSRLPATRAGPAAVSLHRLIAHFQASSNLGLRPLLAGSLPIPPRAARPRGGSRRSARMGLTRTAIRRPLATTMIFLALILLGQQAYTRMRVDRFPAISFPVVFVQIDWPG